MGEEDKVARREVKEWCQKARALLDLAKPKDGAEPLPAEQLAARPLRETGSALMAKGRVLAARGAPEGATDAQIKRFNEAAAEFLKPQKPKPQAKEGDPAPPREVKDAHLKWLVDQSEELSRVVKEIRSEVLQREALAGTLARLPGLVPGATKDETDRVKKLRDLAEDAVAKFDNAAALKPAKDAIEAYAKARDEVAERVAQRGQRAEALRNEAAQVPQAPEEFAKGLDKAREDLALLLDTDPLTDLVLDDADTALADLRVAAQRLADEAADLRRRRALFLQQSQALRAQLARLDLDAVMSLPKDVRQKADEVAGFLDKADATLAPQRKPAETDTFPALLDEAKQAFEELSVKAVSGNSGAREKVLQQMGGRLAALLREADQVPGVADPKKPYRLELAVQAKSITTKMTGSTPQKQKAARELSELASLIEARKAAAGVEQTLFHQRWDAAVAKAVPGPGDIAGCLPAFEVKLGQLRGQLAVVAPLVLSEPEVATMESVARQFTDCWQAASVDAAAAQRTAAVWLRVQALAPDALIAGARGPVKVELQKLLATADAARSATDIQRDMVRAEKLCTALEQRLLAVQAEPPFDDKAALLVGIDPGQRKAAFELCGPALLGQLGDAGRGALSAALAAQGPAIESLVTQGFGGKPAVLAETLSRCGAGGLAVLAQAFAGDDKAASRAALEGLIDQGGLGERPEILARLLGPAGPAGDQAARGAGIKSLADSFGGESGQKAMATLLGDCGLGSQPALLPALMHEHGLAGDGAGLRAFADAFVGDTAAGARADLQRIVSTAGVGAHPKAFAPLVRRGGAQAVKSVGAAFTDPADCARLKGLLESGGLGGRAGEAAGREHEHPDTLAQLVQDGLGGSGELLKAYARAFNGATGCAKSKEMLGAFNEFGPAHAAAREPGKAVGKLLNGPHLKGTPAERIGLLATQFVPQMQAIPAGAQRNQAIRMAPTLSTQAAQAVSNPGLKAAGYAEVTESVSKRHRPESFSLAYAKKKNAFEQTMFPPGADVAALARLAIAQVQAGQVFGATANAAKQDRVTIACPPLGTPITVEINWTVDKKGNTVIHHFGPRNDPPPGGPALTNGPPHPAETGNFQTTEMEAVYKALGLPT